MPNFQIEFSDEQVKVLKGLESLGNISTRKELINNALSLLQWAMKEVDKGRIIASVDENNKIYKEITMPILDAVKAKREMLERYSTAQIHKEVD